MPPSQVAPKQRRSRVTADLRHRPYPTPYNLTSLDRQQRGAQTHFEDKYGVCNDDSVFHDLKCGHRIQAERHGTNCGANCVAPQYGRPFACPQCIVSEVEVEMTLHGLSLSVDKTKTTPREQVERDAEILNIANKKITEACRRKERMCTSAEKFESPTLQFFDTFLREEGFEGIDTSEAQTTLEPKNVRPTDKHARSLTISAPNKYQKPGIIDHRPAPFRPFGNSGTDYTGHGKIATPPSASSQLVPVHKRRKTMANTADPYQPRNQLKDPSWRDRARAQANKQKQSQDVNMADTGLSYTPNANTVMAGVAPSPSPPSTPLIPMSVVGASTVTTTTTTTTPAPAREDDASKAVRFAMAAVVLNDRSGVDAS